MSDANRTWIVKLDGARFFESDSIEKCVYFVNNSHYLRMHRDVRVSISSFVTGASE